MTRYWNLDRVMYFIKILVIFTVVVLLVYYLRGVLFPFFAAFLIAYIVDPLVNYLQKKVKYRVVAVIIVLLGMILVVAGGLRLFVPMVISEIRNLGVLIAKVFNDARFSSQASEYMPGGMFQTIHSMVSWDRFAESMQHLDFWSEVRSIAGRLLPSAWGVLSHTKTIVLWFASAAVIFMYIVFIMLDMPKLRRAVLTLVPDKFKVRASSVARETDRFMGKYFRAQSFVALSVGILYAIGFGIMGLPMGVVFGLFSGALNMIPYMQLTTIPLALVLAVVHALNTGMPFWEVALIICSIYLGVQIIQDFFLVPRIVGGSMNLPPVGILLSLSIWGKLLGFLGLLVAIPFTCLCLAYLRRVPKYVDEKTKEMAEPPPEA